MDQHRAEYVRFTEAKWDSIIRKVRHQKAVEVNQISIPEKEFQLSWANVKGR